MRDRVRLSIKRLNAGKARCKGTVSLQQKRLYKVNWYVIYSLIHISHSPGIRCGRRERTLLTFIYLLGKKWRKPTGAKRPEIYSTTLAIRLHQSFPKLYYSSRRIGRGGQALGTDHHGRSGKGLRTFPKSLLRS